jgi:hypothetical protein
MRFTCTAARDAQRPAGPDSQLFIDHYGLPGGVWPVPLSDAVPAASQDAVPAASPDAVPAWLASPLWIKSPGRAADYGDRRLGFD